MRKKIGVTLAMAMLVLSVQAPVAVPVNAATAKTVTAAEKSTAATKTATQKNTEETAKTASYLQIYFGIKLPKTVTEENFNENLKKVAGKDAPKLDGKLTGLSAIKAAVTAADYKELALSYPSKKVTERLAKYGIKSKVDSKYAAYLACALDTKLVTKTIGSKAAKGEVLSVTEIADLFMSVANANGDARNYLGYSSDADIYAKVDNMWNSFLMYDDKALSELGKKAVEQEITTGYNLKNSAYDARFLPELTLMYGHSDIKHAHQLLGLLNSENIKVKVQMEPKISVYKYLPEWGPAPATTPTYEVKKFSDELSLVYAIEYDMQMEFENNADMLAFDSVIQKYAKKNAGNEAAKGLIASSWWQPLYSTTKTGMPKDSYNMIVDCVVKNGVYSIHPFCLPEDLSKVTKQLNALNKGLKVTPVERYCNSAFYSYLKGEDYQ